MKQNLFTDINNYYNADRIEIKVVGDENYLMLETVLKNILKNIRYKHIESYIEQGEENSVIHVFKPVTDSRKK